MTLSPIALFTYKRLTSLQKTVVTLQNNHLAKNSDLIIFSDAAKNIADKAAVEKVRAYLRTITGFNTITIYESEENKGLAVSIINGVSQIIKQHGKIIVLEDDLVTSTNFLSYTNQALEFFQSDSKIFSIAGYTTLIKNPNNDIYFTRRASSWGWATWQDRWDGIDWTLENYNGFNNDRSFIKEFNKMGSDMSKMLNDQMTGKIDSWAIRWCYHQFICKTYTVYPTISKVNNIGTGLDASNTKDRFDRFATPLDASGRLDFDFDVEVKLDDFYLAQFLNQFSILTRLKFKVLNSLKL